MWRTPAHRCRAAQASAEGSGCGPGLQRGDRNPHCTKCRASHVSWSEAVLSQLSHSHRSKFRVILTRKFASDIRVIRLLRERGLGNSPTRLLKQLKEEHSEEWMDRVSQYTEECLHFQHQLGLMSITFPEPPEPAVVPSCKWLLSVYGQDILTRLDDIRLTKKLAGVATGTAAWVTSVGNEYGQILISVLTAQEGPGLDMMAAGLVRRYRQAGVDPPLVLYVDCGCCSEAGETKLQARFSGWPNTAIRLDIWHFMRRLALACSTNAYQLYPRFMSRLSSCIFEWDAADLALLIHAKRQQLLLAGHPHKSDAEIQRLLSVDELASHCKRRTRGESCTTQLLEKLLQTLMGPGGNDSMGVPLFDRERMEHIWKVQRKHVKCIQDPPSVSLYIKTGEETKGGVRLPKYRCARGSTSLESFHLHLNRFIPAFSPSGLRSYQGQLLHTVNCNYLKLWGKKVAPEFSPPSQYTGELIGVQYLYRQTGQALQDMHPDSEQNAQLVDEHDVEEEEKDEGFLDMTVDPLSTK
ncbi:hypothetical protein WMY93_008849 [Mugilogobius chulae]|uniref:DUF6729 domain-containing protein n=1 Tax=Mugilogobius chulae TaxID=88201 RepID=A0AAW0PD66_9GOBI